MDEKEYRFVYKHFRPFVFKHFKLGDDGITPQGYVPVGGIWRNCGERRDILLNYYRRGVTKWSPALHGGLTICYIYEGDKVVAMAEAECSTKDAFCYRIGREIAKGRALKQLEEEDEG